MRSLALIAALVASPALAESLLTKPGVPMFSLMTQTSQERASTGEWTFVAGVEAQCAFFPFRDWAGAVGMTGRVNTSAAGRVRAAGGAWGFIPFHGSGRSVFALGTALSGGVGHSAEAGPRGGGNLWWQVAPELRLPVVVLMPGIGMFVRGEHPWRALAEPAVSAGVELDLLGPTVAATAMLLLGHHK